MKTFRYVRHHHALDHARLGWLLVDDMQDTNHGEFSVIMQWLCDCPEVVPLKS